MTMRRLQKATLCHPRDSSEVYRQSGTIERMSFEYSAHRGHDICIISSREGQYSIIYFSSADETEREIVVRNNKIVQLHSDGKTFINNKNLAAPSMSI